MYAASIGSILSGDRPSRSQLAIEYAVGKKSKAELHQLIFEDEEKNSLRRHRAQGFLQRLETVASQNRTWLVESSLGTATTVVQRLFRWEYLAITECEHL